MTNASQAEAERSLRGAAEHGVSTVVHAEDARALLAELERLRGIEQRARAFDAPEARYILGELDR